MAKVGVRNLIGVTYQKKKKKILIGVAGPGSACDRMAMKVDWLLREVEGLFILSTSLKNDHWISKSILLELTKKGILSNLPMNGSSICVSS
jgi:hypothetical protein